MDRINLLLLTCLLLTGVSCVKDAVFMYTRMGEDVLLPCTKLVSTDCSRISWTFYRGGGVQYAQLVNAGLVKVGSDKASRLSVTPDCSVSLRHLRADDAGSYVCLRDGETVSGVYLSLLSITLLSAITELQPGGNLSLNCVLFTYYDAGSCKYSRMLRLNWTDEDGATLPTDSRYQLIGLNRCQITLVTNLQREDNNRRWRCQVTTKENVRVVFLDFTSSFLFEDPPSGQNGIPPAATDCPVHLPISRMMLCVALPVMLVIVGKLTWRRDGTRTPVAGIVLQETS